jgi:hypothetical protein
MEAGLNYYKELVTPGGPRDWLKVCRLNASGYSTIRHRMIECYQLSLKINHERLLPLQEKCQWWQSPLTTPGVIGHRCWVKQSFNLATTSKLINVIGVKT